MYRRTILGKTQEDAEAHQYDSLTIQGEHIATAEQLNAYLEQKEPDIRAMMERNYPDIGFTPFPEGIGGIIYFHW